MFKKTCFNCGNKVDLVYNGLCEDCFKEQNPPIQEIKPINIKYCNVCKKLMFNNQYYTFEEINEKIEEIVKKNLVLNEGYQLKELNIINFEVIGGKVSFDVEVDAKLNEIK